MPDDRALLEPDWARQSDTGDSPRARDRISGGIRHRRGKPIPAKRSGRRPGRRLAVAAGGKRKAVGRGHRRGGSGSSAKVIIVAALLPVAVIVGAILGPRLNFANSLTQVADPLKHTNGPVTGSASSADASALAGSGSSGTPTPKGSITSPPMVDPSAQAAGRVIPPSGLPVLGIPGQMSLPGKAVSLPWPSSGQGMVSVAGLGTVGQSGRPQKAPIASVTKVMTAFVVLRDHPLTSSSSGPTITVTAAEAAAYAGQKASNDSLVIVAANEKITERQALQALLLASADNMAEILARWDAGSVPAFVTKMNSNASRLKLSSTHFADPSGLSSASVSAPGDLLKLAAAAMADSNFARIVGTSTADIPLNKGISNTNTMLGQNGMIGLKTGSTSAAGGCLLFAGHATVGGSTLTVYGVVMGVSGGLGGALKAGGSLLAATEKSLRSVTLVSTDKTIMTIPQPDGSSVELSLAQAFVITGWSGMTVNFSIPGLKPGETPATLTARTASNTYTLALVPQLLRRQ